VRCGGREATVQITRRHGAVTAPWQRERAKRTVRQGAGALGKALNSSSTLGPLGAGGGPLTAEKGYLWVSGVSVPLLDPSGCHRRPQCSEQGRRYAGVHIISRGERKSPNSPEPPKPGGKRGPLSRGQVEKGRDSSPHAGRGCWGVRAVQETMYKGKGPGLESEAPRAGPEGRGILWLALSGVGGAGEEHPQLSAAPLGAGKQHVGSGPGWLLSDSPQAVSFHEVEAGMKQETAGQGNQEWGNLQKSTLLPPTYGG